jgi:hypothetical protein
MTHVLAPVGLAALAVVFGYFATLVVKRWEVLRAVSLEVDDHLLQALALAEIDTIDSQRELMDKLIEHLVRAESRALALPGRTRRPISNQILVAHSVAHHLYSHEGYLLAPWALQQAIRAAREVLRPLVMPPVVLLRRPAEPKSFASRLVFARLLNESRTLDEALDAALDAGELDEEGLGADLFP